jgi:hypothetical protein
MRAVVIYESIYGNTHAVADAIATGLALDEVEVVPVSHASHELSEGVDLLVVGGPTHVHGMVRETSRRAAIADAAKPDRGLTLDPDAEGDGLREWFDACARLEVPAAAFDTRMPGPGALTGRASKGIAKRLERHGCTLVTEPESFLVTRDNHLTDEERSHALRWGQELGVAVRAMRGEVG